MVNRIIEKFENNERMGKVATDWLNVLNGANSSAKIVGVLDRGTKVKVLSRVNGFYAIEYGAGRGYINLKYIELVG